MSPSVSNTYESRRPFKVGKWLVEPDLDRISQAEVSRTLRPRVTELLVCLAECADELATKQHLIDTVWRSEFVTVNALTQLIAELRRALGDDAQHPRFIETIPRRGYRLIAETSLERTVVDPNAAEMPRFLLIDDDGNEFGLKDGENLIGRSPEAVIRIDATEVSRRHARILIAGTSATLEDLGSKNGTYLRGRRIERAVHVENADEIQIGANLARFRFKVVDDETRTEKAAG